jgi:hypothetical protein
MYNRTAITNGTFSITINRCNNAPTTASVIAYDLGSSQGGTSKSVTVSSATVNAGLLTACGTSLTEFVNYSLNSVAKGYTIPQDSITASKSANGYTIWAMRKSTGTEYVYMSFNASGTGSVPLGSVNIIENSKRYSGTGSITVNITEYTSGSGGYMAGNFSGNVTDSFSVKPVNLTFRVQKQ